MNFRKRGGFSKFDKIINNGIDLDGFAVPQKPQQKTINFYDRVLERAKHNEKIFNNIKLKEMIITPYVTPDMFMGKLNKKYDDSFLYRLFYSYETYIVHYKEDENEMYSFHGENKIKNEREYEVEKEIISSYARDIKLGFKIPFPDNKIEFLYDFFIFLSTHLMDLIKIKQIEFETRYDTFYKLIIEFKKYIEFHNMNKVIQEEFYNLGYSPLQINIVEYICKNVGLF